MSEKPNASHAARAADPETPQLELADLAYSYPSLRAVISGNPSCYDDLRTWIAENPGAATELANDDSAEHASRNSASVRADVTATAAVIGSAAYATAAVPLAAPLAPAVAAPTVATGAAAVVGSSVLVSWLATAAACMVILLAAGGTSFVVVSARVAAAQEQYYASRDSSTGGSSDATDSSSAVAPPVDPTIAQAAEVLPSTCDDLYSDAMRASLQSQGAVLNPSWFVDNDPEGVAGTKEPSLYALIAPQPRLDCRWLSSTQDPEWGIETTVAFLDSSEAASVNAALAATGYRPLSELGGTRYVLEKTLPDGSGHYGESHIVINNVWFATHWSKFGPSGYTADMVTQTFG